MGKMPSYAWKIHFTMGNKTRGFGVDVLSDSHLTCCLSVPQHKLGFPRITSTEKRGNKKINNESIGKRNVMNGFNALFVSQSFNSIKSVKKL